MVQWGPAPAELVQYVCEADWRVIQHLPEAHQFKLEEE
jgi:hypothetical protein